MSLRASETVAAPAVPGRPIEDASAWTAADFSGRRDWTFTLTPEMVEELDAALIALSGRVIEPRAMRPEDFPLPKTAPLLARLRRELEDGRGFAVLEGFPVDRYGYEDIVTAYCGLGSHIGQVTVQTRQGDYVLDVLDKGGGYNQQARGHYSNESLDFHNDGANTVSLLCLETAARGGESLLVSAPAVYNEVVRDHPEHLDCLHRGFFHHRRNQREPDDPPVTAHRAPVFGFFDGVFHVCYARPSILYVEEEGVPITPGERAALDCVDAIVNRPEMQVRMELRRGDIQFVNNFIVLHARTAYTDRPGRPRHLVRLWLDDPASRRNGPGKMDFYVPEHSRFLRTVGRTLP